ncbi:vitamin D3 receptor B-like [Babylonia areolata]|uniref:vitamin D3 receptor B-like n=1 Tax=Babylonia areolata TaxID=304850 RepID=UPI003FD15D93
MPEEEKEQGKKPLFLTRDLPLPTSLDTIDQRSIQMPTQPEEKVDPEEASKAAQVTTTCAGPLRRKRPLEDKICRICGDKALAHNFDVITCESCKAFFRRNALKWEELRECAFQRSCPINVRTRRFCSACRLKKCFAIGMRADMILDEKKRRARQDKQPVKRSKQGASPLKPSSPGSNSGSDSQLSSEDGDVTHPPPPAQRHGTDNNRHNGGDNHPYLKEPSSAVAFPLSSVPPPLFVPQVEKGKGVEALSACQLPSDPHMYWRLTEEERALLTHISSTYQNTILRLPQQGGAGEVTEGAVNNITLEDLLGRCDVCANNVVKLMKGLSDYRTLQVEDQLAALKACAMRTLILKGAACFVVERDAWIKAYGELPVSLFVRLTGHERLILQHADFCRSLKTLLKNDVTMYALLQCVMLFDPRQPNIADRQLVNALHDKYLLLLKHYLQSQVSYDHAERYLDYLKDKLSELTVLAHHMTDMFRGWTGLIQPLMIEVLSLA